MIDEYVSAEDTGDPAIARPTTLRPTSRRWLKLDLVLDESHATLLWRDKVRELRPLLAQVGAFRDVRVWSLDGSEPDRVVVRACPRKGQSTGERTPGGHLSPDGTRVMLIVSDCVSPAWDSAEAGWVVATWGTVQPVAVLQLLPQRLWRRTALDPGRGVQNGYAGANEPGVPNASLCWRAWRARTVSGPTRATNVSPRAQTSVPAGAETPIPVLTAELRSIAAWADLVRYGAPLSVPAVIFPPPWSLSKRAEIAAGRRITNPSDAVIAFRGDSSALAFKLAELLSAAPLGLPVIRRVQHTLLPESREIHLAEFMLSGLIETVGPVDGIDPDRVDYDFRPGVRDVLLDASFVHDCINVQRTVFRYMRECFGEAFDFDAILNSPEEFEGTKINVMSPLFARVSAEVLKRLGGRYGSVVACLTGVAPDGAPTPPQPSAGVV